MFSMLDVTKFCTKLLIKVSFIVNKLKTLGYRLSITRKVLRLDVETVNLLNFELSDIPH